ncbi:MAG: DUF924 family protein [Rhizobiaceae bacterium]
MKVTWVEDVLDFWFTQLTPEDWYAVKPEVDATIRTRFLALWQEMRLSIPAQAFLDPAAALAATIVFDQFPRNMFRKQADAFATDPLALAVAHNAVRKGFAANLAPERRQFQHMPFMHSEDAADQDLCVRLFEGTDNIKYAVEHRDIVARFGRFPHRNKALGRVSTDAEREFLGGHQGFGQ